MRYILHIVQSCFKQIIPYFSFNTNLCPKTEFKTSVISQRSHFWLLRNQITALQPAIPIP